MCVDCVRVRVRVRTGGAFLAAHAHVDVIVHVRQAISQQTVKELPVTWQSQAISQNRPVNHKQGWIVKGTYRTPGAASGRTCNHKEVVEYLSEKRSRNHQHKQRRVACERTSGC